MQFLIGITILNCIAKLGHRIPIIVHHSDIKILFPVLRKLNTSTDNQIKNVKLRITESDNKFIIFSISHFLFDYPYLCSISEVLGIKF